MRTRAIVLTVSVCVAAAALLLIRSDRRPPRHLAPSVGSVILEGGTRIDTLRAVEDLRISDDKEELSGIGPVLIAPNGSIIFSDVKDQRIRVYGADGKRKTVGGGRGQGPGEFQVINRMGWVSDTIWIHDIQSRTLTFMSADARFIDDRRVLFAYPAPADLGRLPPLFAKPAVYNVRSDGKLLVSGEPWVERTDWEKGRRLLAIGKFGLIHRVVAELPPTYEGFFMESGDARRGGAAVPFLRALRTPFTVSPDGKRMGYAHAHVEGVTGGRIQLIVLNDDGDTLVTRSHPFAGTPIPQATIDSAIDVMANALSPKFAEAFRTGAAKLVPAVYPPISTMMFGRDSTAWIGFRTTTAERQWMVVDWRGEPIATLMLPRLLKVVAADRDQVWGIWLDDNDVPAVVRYRVTGWSR
jgi:hypothetical protein